GCRPTTKSSGAASKPLASRSSSLSSRMPFRISFQLRKGEEAPLASPPLPPPPRCCVTLLKPSLPEGRDEDIDAPVFARRNCPSVARLPSPESGRRQRPGRGHHAPSRRARGLETAAFRTHVSRGRTARRLVYRVQSVASRRTTAAPAAGWAARESRLAPGTRRDTAPTSSPGGAG